MLAISLVKWNCISKLVNKTWLGYINKECEQNQAVVLLSEDCVVKNALI